VTTDDEADPEQMARTVVLRRLSSAPRTRKDLAEDLGRRGIPSDVIDRVLDRFTEVGLIDDAEYARLWVSSRHRSRGTARQSLRHELRAKGITDDDALEALEAIDDDLERARGLALVRSKLPSTSRLEPAASAATREHAHASWLPAGGGRVDRQGGRCRARRDAVRR
jgi:regulatory protein